ncbi:hypothetical protein DCE93_12715 [Agromyces badenianii]|uniref:Uncharacterized protein n=1 Tax=Agromyces badenianii TaxID=2080742 RepID=A0A2S0WYG9_9MICO|nr:hypothetical protein [Agromyces badenianii]AWB96403.1 hypothetical protein DCE93_12715 [Agromyces badenianii]PWC05267.1 hypothetical protein DCE94_02940 [Agromyces badenianii]
MSDQPSCEYSASDFEARVSEGGGIRIIQVTGWGRCPSAGWRLGLVAANPGVVPHPESLWLEIRETPPRGERARVRTQTPIEAIIEDSRAQRIVVRLQGREGFVIPLRDRVGSMR